MSEGATGGRHKDVASRHRGVLKNFKKLLRSAGSRHAGLLSPIRKQFSRFNIWTVNVGADRTCLVSLDHRLREATEVKGMVIELLSDLNEALEEGIPHDPRQLYRC